MEETKNSKKRKRGAPNRKWTDEENMRLLKFLQNNKPFEKPTRRIFYEKFIEQVQMQVDWSILRHKVRNWKTSYRRAKNRNSNEDVPNKDMVYKICPYFDELDKIFKNKDASDAEVINNNENESDSSSDMFPENIINSTEPTIEFKPSVSELNISDESLLEPSSSTKFKEFKHSPSPDSNTETETSKEPSNLSETPFAEPSSSTKSKVVQQSSSVKFANRGVRRIYSQTGLSDMLRVQRSLIEVLKQQCKLQTRKMEEELRLKKMRIDFMQDQFNFEKEKHLKELQIKEKEIESNEKMKSLEIDLERERIVRDIEMKEKIALNELQIKERLAMYERAK